MEIRELGPLLQHLVETEGFSVMRRGQWVYDALKKCKGVGTPEARLVGSTIGVGADAISQGLTCEQMATLFREDFYLNPDSATALAEIYTDFMGEKVQRRWHRLREENLMAYMAEPREFSCSYKGIWKVYGGYTVPVTGVCSGLWKVRNEETFREALRDALAGYPYLTVETIHRKIIEELEESLTTGVQDLLDEEISPGDIMAGEFEYYQDAAEELCEAYGLQLLSCENELEY